LFFPVAATKRLVLPLRVVLSHILLPPSYRRFLSAAPRTLIPSIILPPWQLRKGVLNFWLIVAHQQYQDPTLSAGDRNTTYTGPAEQALP
jgi:hypothetical protein